MGYLSDVTAAIYGDGFDPEKYETLKVLMNTTFKTVYDENDSEWLDSKYVLLFRAHDVKWYDSFPDVQRFMQMLDEIGDIEGFNYEFVRVGADVSDIEDQYGGDNCEHILSVSRSIEVGI